MDKPKPTINQNIMPEMRIIPNPLERVVDLVQRSVKFWGSVIRNTNVPLRESDHYIGSHFTDPLATPLDAPTSLTPSVPLEGGWDDMGTYYTAPEQSNGTSR
jgi:hypothetical protein